MELSITPQEKQFLAYEAWQNDAVDDVIFGGFAGGGKEIDKMSRVFTDKGWKLAGEITTDDLLLAPDGTFTRILGVFPQGIKQMYTMTFDDGASIESGKDHQWFTWSTDHGHRDGWRTKTTQQLLESKGSHAIPLISNAAPGNYNPKYDAYVLGYLIGNGSMTGDSPTIYTAEEEIITILKNLGWRIYSYRKGIWQCQLSNAEKNSILEEVGRRSGQEKRIPLKILFEGTSKTRLAFLQGLMDSDGTIGKDDGSCSFSTMVPQLAEDVVYLVRSLGGKSSIEKKKRTGGGIVGGYRGKYHELDVRVSHCGKFNPFRLQRKRKFVRKARHDKRYIRSIKKSKEADAVCFSVAHASHQYVVQDFIVTHNTWWGSETIMVDALRWPDTRYFIGRKTLTDVLETTFVTLTQKVFPHHKLEQGKHWEFNAQRSQLTFYNGSYIKFLHLGAVPSDPLFDRLGSSEYTRGLIDEGSEVPFRAYDVLKSRVGRWKNKELGIKSKVGITLNPTQDWPYRIFYDPWKKAGKPMDPHDPLVSIRTVVEGVPHERTFVFIPAKPGDNEYTAAEYLKNLSTISDPVLKARLMDGDWEFSNAHDVLFPADAIADMFTNRVKRTNDKYLTVDVARYGGDKIVLNHWKGWDSFKIDTHVMLPIHKTADLVRTAIDMWGIPRAHVLIDADGVGGGVVDLLPGCIGFSGAAAPFGVIGETETRERYENLRTQCIYHAGEKARLRQIAISETNVTIREMIAEDLQQFKRRDADKDGKLKVVKKEDMISALGHSPDCGDSIIMRSYFDLRLREDAIGAGGGEMHVYLPD